MPEKALRLSVEARNDLREIATYGIANFGPRQSRAYIQRIIAVLHTIATHPRIGWSVGAIDDELRRFSYASHVIFYRPRAEGVFIVRIVAMVQLKSLTFD